MGIVPQRQSQGLSKRCQGQIRGGTRQHVCVCVCVCPAASLYVHGCMYMHTCCSPVWACMYRFFCVYIYIHMYVCVCMSCVYSVYIYICVYLSLSLFFFFFFRSQLGIVVILRAQCTCYLCAQVHKEPLAVEQTSKALLHTATSSCNSEYGSSRHHGRTETCPESSHAMVTVRTEQQTSRCLYERC